jgi:pimeloyl-ACP methyl ester carboxylesterase
VASAGRTNVARLREALARQDAPTIVAGHSYGGQIMTALGTDAPNVVALVYIAAFGIDEGESLGALLAQGPPTPATANLAIDAQGYAWLPEDDYVNHFAADVDPVKSKVMHAVQQPLAAAAFDTKMGVPAWKSLPSWYMVARTIRPSHPIWSACSPAAWARPQSRSRAAMSRWSPTRTAW